MIVMEWPAFNIPQVDVGQDTARHERDVWIATWRPGRAGAMRLNGT